MEVARHENFMNKHCSRRNFPSGNKPQSGVFKEKNFLSPKLFTATLTFLTPFRFKIRRRAFRERFSSPFHDSRTIDDRTSNFCFSLLMKQLETNQTDDNSVVTSRGREDHESGRNNWEAKVIIALPPHF